MPRPKELDQIRVRNKEGKPISALEITDLTKAVIAVLSTPLPLDQKQALYRQMLESKEVTGTAALTICQALHEIGRDDDDPRTAYSWED